MNIKLHTPKSLQAGSGMSSLKQFFLALLATTISIVLTFGTASVIDNHKKKVAKKEMVMMVVSDFNKTIELIEKVDTGLRECQRLQQDIAINTEHYDSLRYYFGEALNWITEDFSEITEKIFSTNIETFNTIGDVNIVNEVSSFYMARRKHKEMVLGELKKELEEKGGLQSLKSLMSISFPYYTFLNWEFLEDMKEQRNICMQMMNVSEEDMIEFNKQHTIETVNPEKEALYQKMAEEYMNYNTVLDQARAKLKD
jgi:hypothetical protein